MKCECGKEIFSPIISLDKKTYCSQTCLETSYLIKIESLTKSESRWHEEWFNLRDIIGKLGYKLIQNKLI